MKDRIKDIADSARSVYVCLSVSVICQEPQAYAALGGRKIYSVNCILTDVCMSVSVSL